MVGVVIASVRRVHLVLMLLALTLALTEPALRRYGDNLQIALPMVAWACASTDGRGTELLLRFAGVMAVAHGTKAALGDSALNHRPSGGSAGFPSAHTTAAVFGASSLASDCLRGHPLAQAVSIIAAGFVGGSRIEAQAHDLVQVTAGAALGWAGDRVLRRDSALRRRVAARLARWRLALCQRLCDRFGLEMGPAAAALRG